MATKRKSGYYHYGSEEYRLILTKGREAAVSEVDFDWAIRWCWRLDGHGYARRTVAGPPRHTVRLHRAIAERMGLFTEEAIGFRNNDRLDCRRENLYIDVGDDDS